MTTVTSVSITSAADQPHGEPEERPRPVPSSLSFVAETGDGCRIYRHTNGLYAVWAPASDGPIRTAATLPCAYATCQDITRMTG